MDLRLVARVWLASTLSFSACDEGTGDSSSTSAGDTGGGMVTLASACADWCEKELECHPGQAMPVDDCTAACTTEGETESAACIDAMTDWYTCRADLACNAEGCPEDGIDAHCSDAG